MNNDNKFITSFFRICVKLYNYDGSSDNDIEIKSLNEFITKCNEKILHLYLITAIFFVEVNPLELKL